VPIYYEGRLATLELSEAERPKIGPDSECAFRRNGEAAARASYDAVISGSAN
jgi:hypothetical protein